MEDFDPPIKGVVTAVAVMVGPGADLGTPLEVRLGLAERIQNAMSQAVLDANADGIGHDQPEEIHKRMMVARQKALDDYENERAELIRKYHEEKAAEVQPPLEG